MLAMKLSFHCREVLLLAVVISYGSWSYIVEGSNVVYNITIYLHEENSYSLDSCEFPVEPFTEVVTNFTEVKFCKSDFTITKPIYIREKKHVKLTGNETKLRCSMNSGLFFDRVEYLAISGIDLVNCGSYNQDTVRWSDIYYIIPSTLSCALCIVSSFEVDIKNLKIINATKLGLLMINTCGTVGIKDSVFTRDINSMSTTKPPDVNSLERVHLFLLFTGESQNHSLASTRNKQQCDRVSYNLDNCTFNFNNFTTKEELRNKDGGGAVSIMFTRKAANINVVIHNCTIKKHYALNYSGIFIAVRDQAYNNSLYFNNSSLENNICEGCGGGGIHLDFNSSVDATPKLNVVTFDNCTFRGNQGFYGGGVLITTSRSRGNSTSAGNKIKFFDCQWEKNAANYGSAVDIIMAEWRALMHGPFLTLLFTNCSFSDNYINEILSEKSSIRIFGKGTISSIYFPLLFSGKIVFQKNIGSPLYLSSSFVSFLPHSRVDFYGNVGLDGGAIALVGSSTLSASQDSILSFCDNKAYYKGGAIYYHSTDIQDYLSRYHCFIQYDRGDINGTATDIKPQYIFTNNSAGIQLLKKENSVGKSLYCTTLVPCSKQCNHWQDDKTYMGNTRALDCVGDFDIKGSRESEISTAEWRIKIDNSTKLPFEVVPGKVHTLPVVTTDELNQTLYAVYQVTIVPDHVNSSFPRIVTSYKFVHNSQVMLEGEPEDTALLRLSSEHNREIEFSMNIRLTKCPPGYILNDIKRCKCSTNTQYRYDGIHACNDSGFYAILQSGYWAGYKNQTFLTSICPRGYCKTSLPNDIPLSKSFIHDLSDLVCNGRIGMLCSHCKEGLSVHFHSNDYECKSNRLCHIGWLLYGIAELLPVTLVFLVVIGFDIRLNSGSYNGLILYYQIAGTILLTTKETHLGITAYSLVPHLFITQTLTLNFFTFRELSFCLWRNAATLDIIAFKYFTVVYSLVMVFLTVLVMSSCSIKYPCIALRKMRSKIKKKPITNSVVHGISGFFVLSYSQCTSISLLLLRPVKYSDPQNSEGNNMYVLYNGELGYLKDKHLAYALPAFFFMLTVVIVPPILLVAYPMCYRVFALLKIRESRFVKILCFIMPLEKIKPIMDSFQGSFKDNFRFTSGLYFFYRLLASILVVSTSQNLTLFYVLMEVQLVAMICLHAYLQPYKKARHNRQDLFVFKILALVNILTFLNYRAYTDRSNQIGAIRALQIIALYLPLLYIIVQIGICVYRKGRPFRIWRRADDIMEVDLIPVDRQATQQHREQAKDIFLHDYSRI